MNFVHSLAAAVILFSMPAMGRTLEVGPGKLYARPSQAAAVAQDGDRIIIAPGSYFDCAVWKKNDLVIEGTSSESTIITDKACEGKAIFVISGNNAIVRDLTLTRSRVPDMNGAGIRAEGKDLLVDRVRFIDNQNGIMSVPQPEGQILVRQSEFIRNGTCEAACAHGIYAGVLGLLRVENSTFHETRRGNHIKSRAARTEIDNCVINDGPEGTASYLIDVPNGGALIVSNSRLTKGPNSENRSAAIVIGAEGVEWPTPEIKIENNNFEASGTYPTFFTVNYTATPAMLIGNKIQGDARPLRGDGAVRE